MWCSEVWLSCLWERERLWPVGATACFVTWLTHADCCMCVCLLFKTATASDVEILAMDLLWSHSPRHPSLLCFLSVSYNIRPSLLNDGSFHYKRHLTESRPIHQFTLLVCVCLCVCIAHVLTLWRQNCLFGVTLWEPLWLMGKDVRSDVSHQIVMFRFLLSWRYIQIDA